MSQRPQFHRSLNSVLTKTHTRLPTANRDPVWSQWAAALRYIHQRFGGNADWATRESKAVFRGLIKEHSLGCSPTECPLQRDHMIPVPFTFVDAQNWKEYGRTRLLCLRARFPDLLNVAISPYPYFKPWNYTFDTNRYPADQPVHLSLKKQRERFKYVIYAEGNCGWADRLKHLFLLGFLVFVQTTPCREYYLGFFKPWEHYVPIDSKVSGSNAFEAKRGLSHLTPWQVNKKKRASPHTNERSLII